MPRIGGGTSRRRRQSSDAADDETDPGATSTRAKRTYRTGGQRQTRNSHMQSGNSNRKDLHGENNGNGNADDDASYASARSAGESDSDHTFSSSSSCGGRKHDYVSASASVHGTEKEAQHHISKKRKKTQPSYDHDHDQDSDDNSDDDNDHSQEEFRKFEKVFEKRMAQLEVYKEQNGHCNVPWNHPLLGRWCMAVRQSYKWSVGTVNVKGKGRGKAKGKAKAKAKANVKAKVNVKAIQKKGIEMSEERIRRLEDMGFSWTLPLPGEKISTSKKNRTSTARRAPTRTLPTRSSARNNSNTRTRTPKPNEQVKVEDKGKKNAQREGSDEEELLMEALMKLKRGDGDSPYSSPESVKRRKIKSENDNTNTDHNLPKTSSSPPSPSSSPPPSSSSNNAKPKTTGVEPTERDVLLGRGKRSNLHPGNKRFRRLVESQKPIYFRKENKRNGKNKISIQVMKAVHDWGGRFLRQVPGTGKHNIPIVYEEVEDKVARKKCSQRLREGEVLNKQYYQEMADREDEERERLGTTADNEEDDDEDDGDGSGEGGEGGEGGPVSLSVPVSVGTLDDESAKDHDGKHGVEGIHGRIGNITPL